MKLRKVFLWLLLVLFFIDFSFSVGVYEGQNYNYYTSNSEPHVQINISAGSKAIFVEKGVFFTGNTEVLAEPLNENMNIFSTKSFDFDLPEFVNSQDPKFKLFVYDENDKPVVPEGDPIDFFLKFDNVKPNVVSVSDFKGDTTKSLEVMFDEPIYMATLSIDGKKFTVKNVENSRVVNSNLLIFNLTGFSFTKELYNVKVDFKDLAENNNTYSKKIYLSLTPLNVTLLTIRDDSSLPYNYNNEYSDFFNNTIYTKSDSFSLKIKTNKPATCYFSSGLTQFKTINEVFDKEAMSSSDSLTHSINVDVNLDKLIWIACENKDYKDETAYLGTFFGFYQSLINLKKYDKSSINILYSEPSSLVTNNPFSLFLETDNRAVCLFSLDNSKFERLNSTNYLDFNYPDVSTGNGNHNLKFECVDVLNNKDTVSNTINVDPSQGVRVTDYSPKFVMSASADVEIHLSEYEGINCSFSVNKQVSKTEMSSLPAVTGAGILRQFSVSSLSAGENNVYVYCSKDGVVTENNLEILYDSTGIVIDRMFFINGKYESDTYVSAGGNVKVGFDVQSIIPIQKYVLTVYSGNDTYSDEEKSAKSLSVKGAFAEGDKVVLTVVNALGINKSSGKGIKYDLTEPVVTFDKKSDGVKIICTDHESGCAEVFYGFSQTSFDCHPNVLLGNYSDYLEIEGKNYLCADVYNYVGAKGSDILDLGSSTPSGFIELNQTDVNDTQDAQNNSVVKNDSSGDNFQPVEPFYPDTPIEESSSAKTYVIIGAVVLLLAGAGGGGYYAYKKGYLDKELEKLGIHVPSHSKSDGGSSGGINFTSKPMGEVDQSKLRKSKYDEHLKKLNRFIDDKVSKSKEVFDKFGESNKGKVKGYDDTLIKKKDGNLKKKDFDEFYEGSTKDYNDLKARESLAKEAESFEDYYKKKKSGGESSDKSSKKK